MLYAKLMQGPDLWGDEYAATLDEFETIARQANVTHLREGGPDLDEKLGQWRDSIRVKQELSEIKEGEVSISPLGAEWRFAPDPEDVGVDEEWFGEAWDDSGWKATPPAPLPM